VGRPRIEGGRLQNLWVMAENPESAWMPITLIDWYCGEACHRSGRATVLWYSSGLPAMALLWVLIRDPLDEFDTRTLLCADLGVQPQQIIGWFIGRRRTASAFQEARQRLDFETR
jgi:hypothetical protein